MKRHEALAPLSREHHGALILAQLIKKNAPLYKGLPADVEGKIKYAIDFYHQILVNHFCKEEAVLEKVKHSHKDIERIAGEIITEHSTIKNYFFSLAHTADKEAALDELGHFLESHIRKEERVLFPLVQQHCSEDLLSQL